MDACRSLMSILSVFILTFVCFFGCDFNDDDGDNGQIVKAGPCTQVEKGLRAMWACDDDDMDCMARSTSNETDEFCADAFNICMEEVLNVFNLGFGDFGEVYTDDQFSEALSTHVETCLFCDQDCQDLCADNLEVCLEVVPVDEAGKRKDCLYAYYRLCLEI